MNVKEHRRGKCLTYVALAVTLFAPNARPAFGSSNDQPAAKPYVNSSSNPDKLDKGLSRAKEQLKQAQVHQTAGRWSDVKADLQHAADSLDEAIQHDRTAGKDYIRELKRDTESVLNRIDQRDKHFSDSVASIVKRIEAVQERALDYNDAVWEKFQASSPGSENLINAKLHLRFAEIYEFTTGENDKARAEIDKADSFVKKAESQVSEDQKSNVAALMNQIEATKPEIGKHSAEQNNRYAALERSLTQLFNK
jgi:ElaB/YqjD/DUF883 family membrane-anchored ribosome-binding protein